MDAATLHQAIAEVSPVISCSVGKPDDRSTWVWTPGPGATPANIDAGNNVIATIPVDYRPLPAPDPGQQALYDHENRIRMIEGQPPLQLMEFLAKMTGRD